MPDNFDDLLTDDPTWSQNFAAALKILDDFSTGQLALWPLDDFLQTRRYVPCLRRGTHAKITQCWMCWSDWAWGRAELSELVVAEGQA